MTPTKRVGIVLATVVLASAAPGQERAAEPLVDRVRAAIDSGVRYLRSVEQGTGTWDRNLGAAGRAAGRPWPCSPCSTPASSRTTRSSSAAWIPAQRCEPRDTYVVGLQTMVFAEAGDPKDRPRIQRNVDWLIEARVLSAAASSTAGATAATPALAPTTRTRSTPCSACTPASRPGRDRPAPSGSRSRSSTSHTPSTTGPAAGSTTDDAQRPRPTLTMTIAGLCGLLHRRHGAERAAGRSSTAGRRRPRLRRVRRRTSRSPAALNWLAGTARSRHCDAAQRTRSTTSTASSGPAGCRASASSASHDWYREGCEFLVRRQSDDGSWHERPAADRQRPPSSRPASRCCSCPRAARRSSSASSPDEAGGRGADADWNNKHNDARHLVEYASRELFKRQPLAWQVFDARPVDLSDTESVPDEVGDLLQSPVLYMNGHEAPRADRRAEAAAAAVRRRGRLHPSPRRAAAARSSPTASAP